MSYIIFDKPTGRIVSVSYNLPSTGSHYIKVHEKVSNDFLSGKVPTNNYKVSKKNVGNLYQLIHKDTKPDLGLIDTLLQPFIERKAAIYYYKKIDPKVRAVKRFFDLHVVSWQWITKPTKATYYFLKKVLDPYGSLPGEYYIYKALGYAPINKSLFIANHISEMKNLCVAPWVHLHTWPNNKVLPCCLTPMENTIGDLSESSLAEVWNDKPIRDMRLQFMNDERPASCHRCYSIEDAGGKSYRHHLNKFYADDFSTIRETDINGHTKGMNIKYWDFRFSNICNFKCRSCGPQLSSGWYEDTEQLYGELPKNLPDPKNFATKPSWQELEPLFEIVEEIYFAGGEPLIMEEHYRILNKLVAMEKFNVKLRYNTNFSRLKYKKLDVLDIWNKFKDVKIGASIDAMGPRAEFMRSGTKWDAIVENRNQMKERSPDTHFFTNITLGNMNSFHIIDFYKWIVDNEFIQDPRDIHINLVQFPKHYSLQSLPKEIKKQIEELYLDMADYCDSHKIERVGEQFKMAVNYMNEEDIFEQERNTFRNMTKNLDKIRNESFLEVFPELECMLK